MLDAPEWVCRKVGASEPKWLVACGASPWWKLGRSGLSGLSCTFRSFLLGGVCVPVAVPLMGLGLALPSQVLGMLQDPWECSSYCWVQCLYCSSARVAVEIDPEDGSSSLFRPETPFVPPLGLVA